MMGATQHGCLECCLALGLTTPCWLNVSTLLGEEATELDADQVPPAQFHMQGLI